MTDLSDFQSGELDWSVSRVRSGVIPDDGCYADEDVHENLLSSDKPELTPSQKLHLAISALVTSQDTPIFGEMGIPLFNLYS